MRLLILVDVQNVFYGSRNYSDGRRQVDYAYLIDEIEGAVANWKGIPSESIFDDIDTTIFGYVVQTPKYRGMSFFAFLKRMGYTLRVRHYPEDKSENEPWRGTVSSMMQMDFIEYASNYDVVVVVSGSGVFAPVFKAAQRNWPEVGRGIAAFDGTLHSSYSCKEGLVDLIINLGDEVLRLGQEG
jgi:uncharacterized LabA/DUF88 family protein